MSGAELCVKGMDCGGVLTDATHVDGGYAEALAEERREVSQRRKSVTADVVDDFSRFWDYWTDLYKTAVKLAGLADELELEDSNKMMIAAYAAVTWVARDGRDKNGGAK